MPEAKRDPGVGPCREEKTERRRECVTDFHSPLGCALQKIGEGRSLLLLLDFDGTLVEIAPHPALARPTPELLELLGRLAAREDRKVMLVSGRPLRDLREMLPVSGLDFLGSHGGEALIGGRLHPVPVTPADRQELSRCRTRLAAMLHPFQGWWIEDKPQGFALHYRQLPEEHAQEFAVILGRWREQLGKRERFQLLEGKKILEILPRGVSKGAAIREILLLPQFFGFFPIYAGDDSTDESAFLALRDHGITIRVGHPCAGTAATHSLPDPEAVRQFLTTFAFPLEDL